MPPRRFAQIALAAALLARILGLLLGMEHYGDGPVRVEIAERWAIDPHIWHGFKETYQYGPLHLTLIGGALRLWPDPLWAPRVVSLLCGLAAVWLSRATEDAMTHMRRPEILCVQCLTMELEKGQGDMGGAGS